jgi:tetrahydromethanopterin S-methyltransferase subunit G
MENVENLIIEHLKGLRSEVAALRTNMQEEFKDVKHRLTQVEIQVIGLRRDGASVQEDVYRQQGSIDSIKARLDRIERRLELHD